MRAVFLLLSAGCTLLFDPAGIVPSPEQPSDGAVVHEDLPASVDDLAAPDLSETPDLAPLADLQLVDLRPCVPPTFVGFYDMGSPDPLDCNACGCAIDPLNDPSSWPLKFNHVIPALGWSETFDGGLTMSAPAAASGDDDYFQSVGHFYLDGDFDLLLDYQAQSLPMGAYVQLVVVGPQVDLGGLNLPIGVAQEYQTANGFHIQLVTDDRSFDVITTQLSGTLRLRRVSGKLCASTVGGDELCDRGTGPGRVWLQVASPIGCAAGCASTTCCNYRVRFEKLRLAAGRVVSSP